MCAEEEEGREGKANTSGERWNVSHFDSKTTHILSIPVQSDVESFQKQKYMAAFTDFGDKREYIQFLEKELEQAKYEEGDHPVIIIDEIGQVNN